MSSKILYVEDNPQNMRLVKKILMSAGYEVLEATDGLTSVAMAAREHPDLILMDINLPDINGLEATARLKASPQMAGIPVIALTASAMAGDRERFLAAGCDDYLSKPVQAMELIKMVTNYYPSSGNGN